MYLWTEVLTLGPDAFRQTIVDFYREFYKHTTNAWILCQAGFTTGHRRSCEISSQSWVITVNWVWFEEPNFKKGKWLQEIVHTPWDILTTDFIQIAWQNDRCIWWQERKVWMLLRAIICSWMTAMKQTLHYCLTQLSMILCLVLLC